MSHKANERMFWFRGSAMVVAGRIESPVCDNIDAQGACVLPPTGGFSAASVERFDYRNIIRFERATSTVSGQRVQHGEETAGETLVTVAIEGLNVLDVITADRVVARMTSRHVKGERDRLPNPRILPFGSHFENLRIGGIPVELTPYAELVCEGDHDALTRPRTDGPGESERFPWIDSNGVFAISAELIVSKELRTIFSSSVFERPNVSPRSTKACLIVPALSAPSGRVSKDFAFSRSEPFISSSNSFSRSQPYLSLYFRSQISLIILRSASVLFSKVA